MSKYSIDSTTLSAIGNAIKTKKGNNSSILVSNFASEIANLPAEKEDFLAPFLCQCQYSGHLSPSDYRAFCYIPIPKSIIQKYATISFTYSLYSSSSQPLYDIDRTALTVFLTYANERYNWKTRPSYNSFSYSNSEKIGDIVTDFTGGVSSTYTLNCASLLNNWPENESHILIVGEVKNTETSNHSTFNCVATVGIGEFEGSES